SYILETLSRLSPITAGADLSLDVGPHTFSIEAVNGVQEGVGASKGLQRADNVSVAVGYRGNLLGGAGKPIVTYDPYSRIRNGSGDQLDDKVSYTAYAAGAQVSVVNFDIDLEYDAFQKPKFTAYKPDAAGVLQKSDSLDDKIGSVIGQVAYNVSALHLRPF